MCQEICNFIMDSNTSDVIKVSVSLCVNWLQVKNTAVSSITLTLVLNDLKSEAKNGSYEAFLGSWVSFSFPAFH